MIAADVLIYLGKLDKLFRYSRRAIRDGGRFIFTVEVTNTNRFQVNKTGRFSGITDIFSQSLIWRVFFSHWKEK